MNGRKRTTMQDIAQALDLSINAVSLALNNKPGVSQNVRADVFKTAEALGYFSHRPKYKQAVRQRTLCLIMRRIYFSSSHFYSQIMLGIQEEAAVQGYSVLIELLDEEQPLIPQSIRDRLVSAVLIMGAVSDPYLRSIMETGVSMILVDHTSSDFSIDTIMTANEDGTFRLTRHLLERGYQRFGFIGDLDYSASIRERYAGVVQALYRERQHSFLDVVRSLERFSVLNQLESLIVNEDLAGLWERISRLTDWPDVFICSNDEAAVALMRTLADHNIHVPIDLGVCGFDNSLIASFSQPGLTTVDVPKKVLGREAVRRLIWRTHNPSGLATRTSIQTQLIIRGSTK